MKTKIQILRERKDKERTFKRETSLGKIQDRITELESRVDALEVKV